jgi:hypothetical protein
LVGQLTGPSDFSEIDSDFSTVIRHLPGPSGTLDDGEAVMNVGREVRWPLAPFLGVIVQSAVSSATSEAFHSMGDGLYTKGLKRVGGTEFQADQAALFRLLSSGIGLAC